MSSLLGRSIGQHWAAGLAPGIWCWTRDGEDSRHGARWVTCSTFERSVIIKVEWLPSACSTRRPSRIVQRDWMARVEAVMLTLSFPPLISGP